MKSFAVHALTLTLLLLISGSASATNVSLDDWKRSFVFNGSDNTGHGSFGDWFAKWKGHKGPHKPVHAIPEPSAALVFAAGLLVASQKLRRRR